MPEDPTIPVPRSAASAPAGHDDRQGASAGDLHGGRAGEPGATVGRAVRAVPGDGTDRAAAARLQGGAAGPAAGGGGGGRIAGAAPAKRPARAPHPVRAPAPWARAGRCRIPPGQAGEAEVARLVAEFRARGGAVTLCPPACAAPVRNGDGLDPETRLGGATSGFLA
jgi:hypothetical protein